MLKLAVKILLLFFIVLTASILIRKFIDERLHILPYSYSDHYIHLKSSYLTIHKKDFNSVFIGSSHVFRQFDGHLFDSLAGNDRHLHSFNFGIQGLAASELFYLSDHLLENYKKNAGGKHVLPIKYLFVELSKITFPDHLNLNTTRMYYWYDWNYYTFTLKAIFNSKNNLFPFKIAIAAMHSVGFLDKQFNFSYFNDVNNFYLREKYVNKVIENSKSNYNGYAPRVKTLKKLLADTSSLTLRKNGSAEQFQKYENNPELLKNYNKAYLSKLKETIQKFNSEGIQVIFVFMPFSEKTQYDEIIPLLNQIDSNHKIELADSRKYPELYYAANAADETHLNIKGAKIFTSLLARKFEEITRISDN
ncbi:MAG: hypothetical protein ABI855_13550 [Bacteroidota bacterium]